MTAENPSVLVYAAGTVLGVLSIAFLGVENVFNFSPSLKVLMLVAISMIFLATGLFLDDPLNYASYIMFLSSFAAGLRQIFTIFHLGSDAYFVVMFAGSAVLLGLAHMINEDLISVSSTHARNGAAVFFILLAALILYDVSGGQPENRLILNQDIHIDTGGNLEIGKIYSYNHFHFSRRAELPEYSVCIDNGNVSIESYVNTRRDSIVEGGSLEEFELVTEIGRDSLKMEEIENMSIVKTEDCRRNKTGQISIYELNE